MVSPHLAAFAEALRRDGRVAFAVKVTPKAAKNEVAGVLPGGAVKLKVAAVPEKGKANAAICEFLGRQFGVPKSKVEITRGHASPLKQVLISI